MNRPRPIEPGTGATRTRIVEGDGRSWTVTEAPFPSSDDPARRCLLFSSDTAVRRVRTFPPDWHDRTDAELYEVSLSI